MLKNCFVVALRSLSRSRTYAVINVAGLAVGLSCFLLILLFVRHELSYDEFHERADRIYRIAQQQPGNIFMGSDYFAVTPAPLASTLVREYPEIAAATTLVTSSSLLSVGGDHYWEEGLWADPHFFGVFSFPLLRGRAETALAGPEGIVLTESLSRKIFGDRDPLGQTIRYQTNEEFTVTGVMADVPANSSLQFGFVATIHSQSNYASNLATQSWSNNSWFTFFRLTRDADPAALQAKMPALIDKYVAEHDEDPGERDRYIIEALTDIHMQSAVNFDIGNKGNMTTVYLFSVVAVVILLLACINYMNLAVARSIKRTREVGVRKVIGAGKRQLICQFMGESVLMTFIAMTLALVLVHLLLPLFGTLVDRTLVFSYPPKSIVMLIGLVLFVGIFTGSYPALFMSSLQPIHVLKGGAVGGTARFRVQRLLIVGQYAVSIALLAGSFIIYQQIRFVHEKELGYDREQVVAAPVRDQSLVLNYSQIRDAWLRQANVIAVSSSGHLPTNIASSTSIRDWQGSSEEDRLRIYHWSVDYDYIDVFGIDLVAGRSFSRDIAGDSLDAVVINEIAAKGMGWTPEAALGQVFRQGAQKTFKVIGVVKDFHMHSLHLPIEPLMITLNKSWMGHISARLGPGDLQATIVALEAVVSRFSPYPFEFEFLDETFSKLYNDDIRMGRTFGFFTILALVIASLGLFGLAASAAEQRTKEIGIRKVLGANDVELVALLSREFLLLVGIAFVIATPTAWLATQRWLEVFAYRVEIRPGVFLLTGGLALLIALSTVSYQAIRAAISDPVQSLRYE